MEPMTLGSPVGSPSSPSPYLPGYLMGDPIPQPSSPSKALRQINFAPSTPNSILSTTPGSVPLNSSLSRFHKQQREKSGGPPTVGLFDTLEVSTSSLPSAEPTSPQPSVCTSTYHSVNSDDSEKWVTVFGFPPAAASAVLGQFSQVGHILEHSFPGQGNWVNICYASKLDSRRALSYNGKILGGHTMIGVVPSHPSTQSGNALKDMTNMLSSNGTPKTPQMTRMSHRRLVTSPPTSPYLASPRLGRSFGVSSPPNTEVAVTQNTPTKNTSFVTKAVDFVFGW